MTYGTESPQVSVIIPTYNRAEVVSRAVDSVLGQSLQDFEIIVVDDGSSDETKRVIDDFEDRRVEYIYQSNQGANTARNRGIKESTGEYISFLDSDDEFKREYLAKSVEAISSGSENCIGAASSYVKFSSKNKPTTRSGVPDRELTIDDFRDKNPLGGFSTVTFKRGICNEIGLLDESLPSLQDYDYYIRTSKNHTIRGINSALVKYHVGPENRISNDMHKKEKGHRMIVEKHDNVISEKRISKHHIAIGKLLAERGDLKEARREFLQAMLKNPKDSSTIFYLVLSLLGWKTFRYGTKAKNHILLHLRNI
ncbi:glycosyltransferase family 2 protein [Halobacterium salinarum]|uniref:glycosyltransferase family 2 protein n=1 Tax=Halobacterium salinarum TaxID=2242 RepID=UPI002554F910|nr:glycosyltransferase family 2 protein [Halobacterium salinarum]MDL0145388.1 glycosyltransferase family 2 protein [Halobacterium salinarum]